MGNKRKPKSGSRTVTKAKKKAKADPRSGALRRAAKAREKASAREKKAQAAIRKWTNELDAALTALKKTDIGNPKARKVESSARGALKEMLAQREKLGKARKALRRAEAKERKAAAKKAPAAKRSKAPKKRPAKKRQAEAPAKSSPTKASALGSLPAAEAVSGVDAGGLRASAAASPEGSKAISMS